MLPFHYLYLVTNQMYGPGISLPWVCVYQWVCDYKICITTYETIFRLGQKIKNLNQKSY